MHHCNKLMSITVNGKRIQAREGQTVAQAMLAEGMIRCRTTWDGRPVSVFCGMGICGECRMIVDGIPNTRICQTLAQEGMTIQQQDDATLGMAS